MFRRLRQKLTLVYALLTGAVLLCVALACMGIAERALTRASEAAFESGVNAILYKLQSDRTLSQAYLAQTEASEEQILSIEDGDTPLAFRGGWTPATDRSALIERAREAPEARDLSLPLGSLNPQSAYFQIRGDAGERYLCCISLLPAPGSASPLRITVLRDMRKTDARMHGQRRAVALLSFSALFLLVAIGWFYSGRAVRPAQLSQLKQVEFTAMASHELKAPLAVITASVDALKTCPAEKSREALLGNLSAESLRMARLVDDLLLLSRSDAGELKARTERVDADTLLIECYERFSPLSRSKGLSLSLSVPEEALPAITGDAERLHQALGILLDNALAYTPRGGHIVLSAQARGRYLHLSVTDDGPGIPDSLKAAVFERFSRADAAHHDRAHAGLGLSIAREIVRTQGGRIELSDALPHGARFTIVLKTV